MNGRTLLGIGVAAVVAAAGIGVLVYLTYLAPGPVASQNWAGYADGRSEGFANGTIALPSPSDWHGNGEAGLWVGMGGISFNGGSEWPFWQAGVLVSCTSGECSGELFDEGGTQGAPCNGVCPIAWSQPFAVEMGDSITVSVSGGSSGALATLTVDQDGFNTTYNPPPWTVLADVTSFPSAEWIFESPQESGATAAMPTLTPPGALFSSLEDSGGLSALRAVEMQDNPNGQSVGVSSVSGGSFSAYSYDS